MTEKELEMQRQLEKRNKDVALSIIEICRKLPRDWTNEIISKQLIRAVCSIGANYREACNAESRVDFKHKIGISRKEAHESLYWVELLAETNPNLKVELRVVYKEINELLLIFSKAFITSRKQQNNLN